MEITKETLAEMLGMTYREGFNGAKEVINSIPADKIMEDSKILKRLEKIETLNKEQLPHRDHKAIYGFNC